MREVKLSPTKKAANQTLLNEWPSDKCDGNHTNKNNPEIKAENAKSEPLSGGAEVGNENLHNPGTAGG